MAMHSSLPSPHHGQSHSLPVFLHPVRCSPVSCTYYTDPALTSHQGSTALQVWRYPDLLPHQYTAVHSCCMGCSPSFRVLSGHGRGLGCSDSRYTGSVRPVSASVYRLLPRVRLLTVPSSL